jgi:hypothetical protein
MLKELITTSLVICLICGVICITINLVKLNYPEPKAKIIYRYIPKTFDEEQKNLPLVSEIFKSMFTDQTPWIESVMTYDRRQHEAINKYFVSQI